MKRVHAYCVGIGSIRETFLILSPEVLSKMVGASQKYFCLVFLKTKMLFFFFFPQNWSYYSDATIQNHFSGTFTQIDVKMKFISRLMCFCFFLPRGNCLHCVISHPLKLSGKKYWITSFSCLFFRQFIGSEKRPLLYFCLLTSMSVSMKITPPATCRIFAVTVVSFHSANGGFHAFKESLCSLLGFLLKTQTFQIYKKLPSLPLICVSLPMTRMGSQVRAV